MKLHKLGFAILLGAGLGAISMHLVHAQSPLPAYLVIDIDVTNADLYKEYLAKGGPIYPKFGGRFLSRGGKIEPFAGEAPKRAVVAVFDSLDQAKAFRDSTEYKALVELRDRASKFHAFIVEGSPT